MISFISNSKRWLSAPSRPGLSAAFLLIVFFGVEAVTRGKLFQASKDLSRFATYDERARRLVAAPSPRVAFVGNSLTDRGVDADRFGRLLNVASDKFVADGSHVNTWYWIIERQFWKRDLRPDLIVMNFYETSLEDGKQIEVGRLAQFFTDHGDWMQLFKTDILGLEPRVELVLSSFWATYAVRDRLKERTLGLIPGYRPYTEHVHSVNYEHERQKLDHSKVTATRLSLERLCDRAREKGTRLLFVAFPSLGKGEGPSYEIPPETEAVVRSRGHELIDLRVVPVLSRHHYEDDVHLTVEGQVLYTEYLADKLASYVVRRSDSPNILGSSRAE